LGTNPAALSAAAVTLPARVARRVLGHTEWYLRHAIRRSGGRVPATPPRVTWMNTTLKSHAQVEAAIAEVHRCGLVPHGDRPKNWDALGAVDLVLKRTLPQARVLEVGAELYSVLLPWLYQYGYRNLTGIDLVHRRVIRRGPIICEPGDLTRTRFPDATFDVIGSLSVIEHGVPLDAYFSEMWRLLRPGGMLITSTDYWHEPVDPRGQTAYGVPIRVFTPADIDAMIALAERHGFRLTGPLDTVCDERAVTWKRYGLSYTYINFALERE